MKKKIFLLGLYALVSNISVAQQQWRIDGNSNTNNTNFIGTTVSQPFAIKTNNNTQALFDADGNITFYGYAITINKK